MIREFQREKELKCDSMSEIITFTKIQFDPASPTAEDINIRDIAHALSFMVRANGHFPVFYSVGQHCIHCCEEAAARGCTRREQLACLLHDASEAYLADITRPVKQHLEKYREIEQRLQECIFRKYLGALSEEEKKLWRRLDDTLLYYEFNCLMGRELKEHPETLISRPAFAAEPFERTERHYLAWFGRLYEE